MSKFAQLPDFVHFLENELMLSQGEVQAESEIRALRTWSSLNALILISRINDELDILLSASDLAKCTKVLDLHRLINDK